MDRYIIFQLTIISLVINLIILIWAITFFFFKIDYISMILVYFGKEPLSEILTWIIYAGVFLLGLFGFFKGLKKLKDKSRK